VRNREPRLHRKDDQLRDPARQSFTIARPTCVRTVAGVMNNSLAICSFDNPVATHATISLSRPVSVSSPGTGPSGVARGVGRDEGASPSAQWSTSAMPRSAGRVERD
jgi:hypothetical protein